MVSLKVELSVMRTSIVAKIQYAGVAVLLSILGAAAVDRGGPEISSKPPSWVTYSPPPVSSTTITTTSSITSSLESLLSPTAIFSTIPPAWSNSSSISAATNPSLVLGTTLIASPSPFPSSPSYTFSIEISNQRQHVGRWYGRYISSDLNKLLKNRCDDDKIGANTCKTSKEKFDNIEYSNQAGMVEKGIQFVEVGVESDYIPGKHEGGVDYNGKSLQNAFISQIAYTFQLSGEDEKNCYRFDRRSTMCTFCKICIPDGRDRVIRWCNAPEYVRVSVKNGEGKEVAHMKAVLKFTGTTDKGKFDCMAIKESVERSARDDRAQQNKPWRNAEKGRKGKGKRGRMGQDESRVVDPTAPPQTLEARTLEALAQYVKDGRAQKIVVMTGAGISTSAGIPDFRSPETGLYANLSRLNLPYPEAVFDIDFFRKTPEPFYALAQELYPGKFRPTITHSFISLLHQKGLLLKLFTQNIDCLEREAGVPGDKIIEAHGSFASQCCIDCKKSYPKERMNEAIRDKSVPHCVDSSCNGLVKPEIVFFGEQLPSAFFDNRSLPAQADLCIVMGTSLSVHPFASLPQLCEDQTPRLLINSERVGDMGQRTDDVLLLEDCDSGVRKLAEACGWLGELEALWATTAPVSEEDPVAPKEEVKKSHDELLEDEVEKLTREVEENLRLNQAEHEWLDNHVDNKLARKHEEVQVGDRSATEFQPTVDPESRTGPSESKTNPGGGGLAHVFPHMNKSSL
ncbi:NAD-dependent protein deacetylase hst2-1 [Alternaria tenuissima]|uniref:NAD-dependent protein deacetylase hst2-1 n=2 Tax=Alternaria alternata complex TaxID=187734 RepID=A0A4Q4NKN6_ALTAL|nr:NAD-dependent protein deacetylase hst2-1 [Alternaria alternata]RYO09321.1 NAD-dependent protein deacetylase hst2-1 [Alternaria tenuissima]RYO21299.1 NAD-dependent protein deacetylase hst2-1 [Alternaria tenuissima]